MQPKPVSFRNILPQRIALFSADTLRRYPVFMDRDIGIPKEYRQFTKANVTPLGNRKQMRIARALKTWWRSESRNV